MGDLEIKRKGQRELGKELRESVARYMLGGATQLLQPKKPFINLWPWSTLLGILPTHLYTRRDNQSYIDIPLIGGKTSA